MTDMFPACLAILKIQEESLALLAPSVKKLKHDSVFFQVPITNTEQTRFCFGECGAQMHLEPES